LWNVAALRRSLLVVSLLCSAYLLYRDYQKTRAGLARQAGMSDVVVAAYRFSEENYHTQLELWEVVCEPTAERLDDFQRHKRGLVESFQAFATLLDRSSDVDPEISAIARDIAGYYTQIVDSWDGVLRASGEGRQAAKLSSERLLDRFGLNKKIARIIELQNRHIGMLHASLQGATWKRLVLNESLLLSVSLLLGAAILFSVMREGKLFQRLAQAEKLSALGQLSAGVAHELNNPLTFIRGFNNRVRYTLRKKGTVTPEIFDYLNEVDEGADRMSKIIDHLRTFSRRKDRTPVAFSVNETIRRAFDFFEEQVRLRGIHVDLQLCAEAPEVEGFPNRFEQAMINLLTNARDAMEGWEQRQPATIRVRTVVEAGQVVVCFEDNGPGISKKIAGRIFEPFFTTKPTGAGTGLGLSIVNEIVKEHAGTVSVESPPGQGARFTIRIPLAHEACRTTPKG
jgi:signal transduction histidine kinase